MPELMNSEEAFVRALIQKTGNDESYIGDDCAVIPEFDPPLLFTVDSLNKSIHYDAGYSPRQIGQKLAGINLSDIHAMGGIPRWALLSVTSSRDIPRLEEVLDGTIDRLNASDVPLTGGDYSTAPEEQYESHALTVIGQAHPDGILLRSTAQPGDRIAVTGSLGSAGAILSKKIEERTEEEQSLLSNPPAKRRVAEQLVVAGVRCGIDVSDGFVKDLKRICEQSGVGARVNPQRIPIHDRASVIAGDEAQALEWALTSGEDYELLVTAPDDVNLENLDDLTVVGTITKHKELEWDPSLPGEINLESTGYDHFN